MRVLLCGLGYWGANYARDLAACPAVTHVATVDPAVPAADYACIADAPDEFDGAVVACPASAHLGALEALAAKRRLRTVLVEKPLATSTRAVRRVGDVAAAAGWAVMVGHTFLHHATVRGMLAATFEPWFGALTTVHAKRTNWGPVRTDVGAHWDLAPHDLSVILTLAAMHQCVLRGVAAHSHRAGTVAIVLTFTQPAGPAVLAHVWVSWEEPHKERRVVAVGEGGKVEFDDVWTPTHFKAYTPDGGARVVPGRAPADLSPLQQQIAEWVGGRHDTAEELRLAGQIVDILERVDGLLAAAPPPTHGGGPGGQ